MKKWISLLMAITLLLGFCACGSKESDALPDVSSTAEAVDAATSTETTSDCVTVEETETKYGLIQIPQINESMLKSEDVRLANKMFRNIRNQILEQVKECENEWGDEAYRNATEPLSTVRYTQNDNISSIAIKYTILYPYYVPLELYAAANIDVYTGKALDHKEVIRAAGFTEDEVKAALYCYADRSMFLEWENSTFYTYAAEGTIPDGLGDPSYLWQDELDELTASYDDPAYIKNGSRDVLTFYPTVYMSETGLEVCASIPTTAGSGYYDTMVCIGHNDPETKRLNPKNPYGQPFGQGAIPLEAAYEAIAQGIGLEENHLYGDDAEYNLSIDSMELIGFDEHIEPSYVCRLYTDEGDHIATSGWYAVNVFSGDLWEMDLLSGEWTPIMNGTGLLPEEIYTGADMAGALAVIWSEPGSYGIWAANPCAEVDLVAYGSNSDHYVLGGEAFLLFARENGTLISFESGSMEGDAFTEQRQLYSIELNAGDSVLVYALLPEGAPTQAINVSTKSDAGKWILRDSGLDGTPEFTYVTSFSSLG